jgi:tight adherence protein B
VSIGVATAGWLLTVAVRARVTTANGAALGRALRLLSAELAAGSAPAAALSAAAAPPGAYRETFQAAAVVARDGGDVPAALLADDTVRALRPVAAAWRVASQTGAGLADIIDRVEMDLGRRREQEVEVATKLAGARSSAVLLALLPVLGLVLGSAMGADPMSMLFGSVAGQALLGIGVLLDSAGLIWTAHIVGRATR